MTGYKVNGIEERIYRYALENVDMYEIRGKCFLVAGATSFLGASIIKTLLYFNGIIAKNDKEKCTIYGLYHDERKIERLFGSRMSDARLKLIKWDALNVSDEIVIDGRIDYVYYLCSIATTDMSKKKPVETLLLNTIGLDTILRFATGHNVKSILYFSSGAIYGDVPGGTTVIKESDRYTMDHMSLSNAYGEGKRAGEALCNSYYEEFSLPVRIVRISHTYGPGIDLNDGRVFSDFISKIINNEDLIINGDGKASRPFCYISDALRAFFLISFKGENGKAYNMANPDETYTISELAEKLVREGFPNRKLSVEYRKGKPQGVVHKPLIDIDLIRSLGWKPMINAIVGFRETVNYYETDGKQ